jgi:hypothetical protein
MKIPKIMLAKLDFMTAIAIGLAECKIVQKSAGVLGAILSRRIFVGREGCGRGDFIGDLFFLPAPSGKLNWLIREKRMTNPTGFSDLPTELVTAILREARHVCRGPCQKKLKFVF